jgi:hypothetical protein
MIKSPTKKVLSKLALFFLRERHTYVRLLFRRKVVETNGFRMTINCDLARLTGKKDRTEAVGCKFSGVATPAKGQEK